MLKRQVIIATRQSPLALQQAEWVKERLQFYHPGLMVELMGTTTEGDILIDVPLRTVGGKGLFVKALEAHLLAGRADIAVHSMKDVPMDLPKGLSVPVVCEREDPHDVFVSRQCPSFAALPQGGTIGTSSLRRQSQLCALRPDVCMEDLRGNLHTRLQRLAEGRYDGIVLAAAGLKRLGLAQHIRAYFSIEESLPAAGQGALGIECREDDTWVQAIIGPLQHQATFACVRAEREACQRLGGGCTAPIAAYAAIKQGRLWLHGLVGKRDGTQILRASAQGGLDFAAEIGHRVAEELIKQGAEKLLQENDVHT